MISKIENTTLEAMEVFVHIEGALDCAPLQKLGDVARKRRVDGTLINWICAMQCYRHLCGVYW